jgi:outer membrane protein OmpA-like peptidoglycan-associated protein
MYAQFLKKTGLVIAASAFVLCAAGAAYAQSALQNTIENSLTPKTQPAPVTRGLSRSITIETPDPKAAAEKQFVDRMRTRSISIEPVAPPTPAEREQIAVIAHDKPSIDLEILFDYNSADVGPRAAPVVIALGNALSKDQFKGAVFFINGYTDAKGSPDYNMALSQRRAEAVRRVLIERYGLSPQQLIPTGFGLTNLKNPSDPFGEENRRVQIVNTTQTAGK